MTTKAEALRMVDDMFEYSNQQNVIELHHQTIDELDVIIPPKHKPLGTIVKKIGKNKYLKW